MKKTKLKEFVIESGKTLNSAQQFVELLSYRAKEVEEADECDVILAFCPIVSRVGTDIEAALKVFKDCCPTPKPIVLVVLHHTFDREYVIPDCNRYARDHVSCIVNGLFHEDEGLLKKCEVNTQAIDHTLKKLKEIQGEEMNDEGKTMPCKETNDTKQTERQAGGKGVPQNKHDKKQFVEHLSYRAEEVKKADDCELAVSVARHQGTKPMWIFNLLLPLVMRLARFMGIERHLQTVIYWLGVDPAICSSRPPVIQVFTIVIGNTLGCHESFLELLKTQVTLKRVDSPTECDVILAFCPIVSRVGTDIGAALPRIPDCKPAILVVLHHTFDADYVIPSASKFILDRNIRIVDCLFYDSGLLTSHQNDNAVKKMVAHLKENKTD